MSGRRHLRPGRFIGSSGHVDTIYAAPVVGAGSAESIRLPVAKMHLAIRLVVLVVAVPLVGRGGVQHSRIRIDNSPCVCVSFSPRSLTLRLCKSLMSPVSMVAVPKLD